MHGSGCGPFGRRWGMGHACSRVTPAVVPPAATRMQRAAVGPGQIATAWSPPPHQAPAYELVAAKHSTRECSTSKRSRSHTFLLSAESRDWQPSAGAHDPRGNSPRTSLTFQWTFIESNMAGDLDSALVSSCSTSLSSSAPLVHVSAPLRRGVWPIVSSRRHRGAQENFFVCEN